MFPLSLSGTAFTWFTSLAPNSIFTWAQLEQKIYEYFYFDDTEFTLSHLTAIKQKHNKHVAEYIRRFRDTRNLCFNLNISDKDLADLAY
jgi:DNA-binding response OmpR family regulator